MAVQDVRERLKDDFIETCRRIELMRAEAKAQALEWRRNIKAAVEHRRNLLARLNGMDGEAARLEREPVIPGMEDAYNGTADEE